MKSSPARDGAAGTSTIAITDSGLGGLLICAELERRLRETGAPGAFRLVYVNAWPDPGRGYNDLPDLPARAAVFDRALGAMAAFRPDLILIACNTLSVVYEATDFGRAPAVPVKGILEAGTDLFHEALARDPDGVLVLFGTRTTIGSGEHVRRLIALGVDRRRLVAEPCHGLAAVIDKDPDSPEVAGLVDACVLRAMPRVPPAGTLYSGLACTHYAYVGGVFESALARHGGARVRTLDPGLRLIDGLMSGLAARAGGLRAGPVAIEVVSKVELPEAQRLAMARRLELISPATARALLGYRHIPDLFQGETP